MTKANKANHLVINRFLKTNEPIIRGMVTLKHTKRCLI